MITARVFSFIADSMAGMSSWKVSRSVQTSRGTRFLTRTIFIAAGVGAFQPRTLKVDGLDKFEGSQVFYRVKNPADFAGKNLVIVGGGDSALDWTLQFAQEGPNRAESVILLHRRDGFKAAPASVAKMRELCDAHEMQFSVGQVTGCEEQDGKLTGVKVTGSDGVTRLMPLDMLLVFFGLSPKLGPIAQWGLDIERKQLKVDTEKFSTKCARHLRGGRHQHLPRQEEADPVGLPRVRAGRLRRRALHLPGQEDPPAVHDHQPQAAQGAGGRDAGVRLRLLRRQRPVRDQSRFGRRHCREGRQSPL
jgi:hypothetical protein